MNAGARIARAGVLFFVHVDTVLPHGFPALIRTALANREVVAGCFRLRFDSRHPVLRLSGWLSRINHPLFTYGDQTLFVRAETFWQAGGFAELPLFEDVEIQQRLRRAGRFVKLQPAVVTSARRYRSHGVLRQQSRNLLLAALFAAGVPARRLSDMYPYG